MSSNAFLSFGITDNSINYRPEPEWFTPPFEFTSSNLPIVLITTKPGENIINEPKITADMKIIDNGGGLRNNVTDSGNVYTGKVGIEIRGKYPGMLMPIKRVGFIIKTEIVRMVCYIQDRSGTSTGHGEIFWKTASTLIRLMDQDGHIK